MEGGIVSLASWQERVWAIDQILLDPECVAMISLDLHALDQDLGRYICDQVEAGWTPWEAHRLLDWLRQAP